jgi:hypothetical protein
MMEYKTIKNLLIAITIISLVIIPIFLLFYPGGTPSVEGTLYMMVWIVFFYIIILILIVISFFIPLVGGILILALAAFIILYDLNYLTDAIVWVTSLLLFTAGISCLARSYLKHRNIFKGKI